ncbi:MAG: hypothetical protein M1546_10425 [Chloroflexi bacterium]|nr:hypothetical protein [Chloroflexota bacterium]
MLKPRQSYIWFAFVVMLLIAAVSVLLITRMPLQASMPQATTATFTCTPAAVAVFTERVHVRCSTGAAPGNAIFYFAYCSQQDSALASRFLSTFTTAKVTGKNVIIFYSQNDLSGANCGCSTSDCRVLTGAEVQQ